MGFKNNDIPVLDVFSMLLVNNNRSKAYLQNLIMRGHLPARIIILDSGDIKLPEHTDSDGKILSNTSQRMIRSCREADISFDEKEHVTATVLNHKIPFTILPTLDVNSEEVIAEVSKSPGEYIVYSGPGGTILRPKILSAGKHFLHVHPGWLPDYRGSTTVYYSMLAGDDVGCSVIRMVEEVDEGPVFYRRKFQPLFGTDLDYVLDPAIRTAALVDFFDKYRGKPPQPIDMQDEVQDNKELFFIIHPLLKHLSILRLENNS